MDPIFPDSGRGQAKAVYRAPVELLPCYPFSNLHTLSFVHCSPHITVQEEQDYSSQALYEKILSFDVKFSANS